MCPPILISISFLGLVTYNFFLLSMGLFLLIQITLKILDCTLKIIKICYRIFWSLLCSFEGYRRFSLFISLFKARKLTSVSLWWEASRVINCPSTPGIEGFQDYITFTASGKLAQIGHSCRSINFCSVTFTSDGLLRV